MELITKNVRVRAPQHEVLQAITTTQGHRGWWFGDCDVGKAAGEEATYRGDGFEVVFRIERLDERGIEMTCTREKNCSEWRGTRLTIRAFEDGDSTYVDLVHDGWRKRTAFYDVCVEGWQEHFGSIPSYCESGSGAPYLRKRASR